MYNMYTASLKSVFSFAEIPFFLNKCTVLRGNPLVRDKGN